MSSFIEVPKPLWFIVPSLLYIFFSLEFFEVIFSPTHLPKTIRCFSHLILLLANLVPPGIVDLIIIRLIALSSYRSVQFEGIDFEIW